MKYINKLLFLMLLISFGNNANAQCVTGNCWTTDLELSTGWNGDSPTPANYLGWQNDGFWNSQSASFNSHQNTCSRVLTAGGTSVITDTRIFDVEYPAGSGIHPLNASNTHGVKIALDNNTPPNVDGSISHNCLGGNNGKVIVYSRKFGISCAGGIAAGQASLKFAATGDYYIRNVTFSRWNGGAVVTIFSVNPPFRQVGCNALIGGCNADPQQLVMFNGQYENVINTFMPQDDYILSVELENDGDVAAACVSMGGTTSSWLQVESSFHTNTPGKLFSNLQYGRNPVCNIPYPLSYNYSVNGFPSNSVKCQSTYTANLSVLNAANTQVALSLLPNTTYSVSASNGFNATYNASTTSSIIFNGAGVYTLSVGYHGCYKEIGKYTLDVPTLTVSPSHICVNPGANAIITASATAPGNPSFTYTLFKPGGGQTVSAPTTGPTTYTIGTPTGVGVYTVSAYDANGCMANSVTFSVGNKINAQLTSSNNPSNCIPINGNLTLTAAPFTIPNLTYALTPPAGATPTPSPPNQWNTSANGLYSVTITDAGGCSSSSAITLRKSYSYTYTVTPNCFNPGGTMPNVSITSLNNITGPLLFNLSTIGTFLSSSSISIPIPSGNNTSTFTLSPPANINGYCPAAPSNISIAQCQCSSAITYTDFPNGGPTNSSAMWSTWGGNAPPFNIRITQDITIDQNCSILNNNFILVNPGVKITILDGKTLDIRNSKLYGCGKMWDGIYVGTSTGNAAGLKVFNSTISDMLNGIDYPNGQHTLTVANCILKNNGNQSIKMTNDLGVAEIFGTTFTCDNDILFPFNYTTGGPNLKHSNNGIVSVNPITGSIGHSLINTFNNLYCGIDVQCTVAAGPLTKSSIFNCLFQNIHNFDVPVADDFTKSTNMYNASNGAGIYSNIASVFGIAHNLSVYNNTFTNSDKGLILRATAPFSVNTNTVNNCLIGIASLQARRASTIAFNTMSNVNLGIECREPYYGFVKGVTYATINNNNITTTNFPLLKTTNTEYKFPVGIRLAHIPTVLTGYLQPISSVYSNFVDMTCERGICYHIADVQIDKVAYGNQLSKNEAKLTNGANGNNIYNLSSVIAGIPIDSQVCYFFENCNGGFCANNKAVGNYFAASTAMWNVNNSQKFNSTGYLFYKSKDVYTSCNTVNHTTRGFVAKGNSGTLSNTQTPTSFGDLHIKENKCNANRNPWYFEDDNAGAIGTFGDVGELANSGVNQDCDNHFLDGGINPNVDWRQRSTMGVPYNLFRRTNSTLLNGNLYTHSSLCMPQNSSSNNGNNYNISNITAALTFTCPSSTSTNKTGNFDPNATEPRRLLDELDGADDVVGDSIPYNVNEEVLRWMDNQALYAQLDKDADLRESSEDLQDFYDANKYTEIGQLYDAQELLTNTFDSTMTADYQIAYKNMAQQVLQNIETELPYATLQRTIMLININEETNGIDAIDDSTWAWVDSIALQCPSSLGTGVYAARILYAKHSIGRVYNDNVVCNTNAGGRFAGAPSTEEDTPIGTGWVNVFPNPASGSIKVTYACSGTQNGIIELYDLMGHLVSTTTLSFNSHESTVDIAKMQSGLYIYKVLFDGCGTITGKIQINN